MKTIKREEPKGEKFSSLDIYPAIIFEGSESDVKQIHQIINANPPWWHLIELNSPIIISSKCTRRESTYWAIIKQLENFIQIALRNLPMIPACFIENSQQDDNFLIPLPYYPFN